MKIKGFLKKDLILPNLKAIDKQGALRELADMISVQDSGLNNDAVLQALLAREKLGSTGMEDGVAIPHAKIQGLNNIVLAFGRSLRGIDFKSIDGKPTTLMFLLLAPEDATGLHLKVLARLSRLLKDIGFRGRLLSARGKEDIYKAMLDIDEKF